jgi:FkbM family methyltransferase
MLNVYTRNFSFPHRGLKYFLALAKRFGLADKTYLKKLPEGFYINLNPSEHIQQQLFWYGYYEKELGNMIKKVLNPGDVFFDVGANIGYFSLLAATSDPTVKVVAFEPVKDLFQKLERNVLVNGLKNIIVVHTAVGEINEEKEIFLAGNNNLGMSSFHQPENYSGRKEKVKVLALDDWFQTLGLSRLDLIKLDIEGSELNALKGMRNMLEKFKPLLLIEINPDTLSMFGLIPKNIYDYLNQLNFDGYIIDEKGRLTEFTKNKITQTANTLFAHEDRKFQYDIFKS